MNASQDDRLEEGTDAPRPVRREERIVSLDLIRGIAVLGILLANVTAFAHVDLAYYWPPALPGGASESDAYVWLTQLVLVDGKFRGLFTILFGAGMVLFTERIAQYDRAVFLQARRLFWLALFGLAHFYLLFTGDILFSYACGGFFALFALPLKARTLLWIGCTWALLGAALRMQIYGPVAMMEADPALVETRPQAMAMFSQFWMERVAEARLEGELAAFGSYADIVRYRFTEQSELLGGYFTLNFYETIPLLLIGMGLYRSGVFNGRAGGPRAHLLAWAGVAFGVSLNFAGGLYVLSRGFPPFATQFVFFGLSLLANLPLLIGATYLLGRWASAPVTSWLGERLVAAGRVAFTNYVGTSLVMVLIFQGWAGGLFGTMHRLELLLVVGLGWALMLWWPRPWLARYRHGPLEYLWRCLIYWRLFPLRR